MQALDKPNDLRARVEFRFGIKKARGSLACNAHIAAGLAGTYMFPATTAVYTLPISAALITLAPAVAASVSLAFHPVTAFQPLHPMTTSKHSEKTIVAQLNSDHRYWPRPVTARAR